MGNAAVRANAATLKQFAMLRNAIIHNADYPPHIVAVPSPEALTKFNQVACQVLEPAPLIPMFARQVRCFSSSDTVPAVLEFMRRHDFSQVIVRKNSGNLCMLTVEGISWWLADNLRGNQIQLGAAILEDIIALEPPGGFKIMSQDRTIFDAADAFKNCIDCEATRLYAAVITRTGDDRDEPVGFVTPWDLVHNPRLQQ